MAMFLIKEQTFTASNKRFCRKDIWSKARRSMEVNICIIREELVDTYVPTIVKRDLSMMKKI